MLHAHANLLLLASAVVLLAACGGSGGALPASSTVASLTGEVVEIDGQDLLVAGVVMKMAETGETAVTDATGAFAFPALPTGSITLEMVSCPTYAAVYSASSGNGSPGDSSQGDTSQGEDGQHGGPFNDEEIDDGEDCNGQEVNVHRLREQERVHVRLRIRDGEICEMECVRDQNRECEVEVVLSPTEANEDEDLAGKLEIETRDDRERLKVYVWNATTDLDLEAVVVAPDGDEESLGTQTVDGDGEAAWLVDASAGDDLPFGVLTLADLEGYTLEVRDADTGVALLAEEIPSMPPYFGEHGDGGDQQRSQTRDQDQEGARTGYDDDAETARGS